MKVQIIDDGKTVKAIENGNVIVEVDYIKTQQSEDAAAAILTNKVGDKEVEFSEASMTWMPDKVL